MKLHHVKRNSKMDRVRRWFKENPGESLSPTDLRIKFGISDTTVRTVVLRLRSEGLIHPESVYLATTPARNDEERGAA